MKEKFLKALVIYFFCVNALYTADLSGEAQQESLSNPTEPHPVAEQAISRLKSSLLSWADVGSLHIS